MDTLSPRDPRNPRIHVTCPRCSTRLVYLGTFPKAGKVEPMENPLDVLTDPGNTHVYSCVTHGRFWLDDLVGLKAAPKG